MMRRGCLFLLAAAPLLAQSWQPQAGAVWSQPQGDLKQVSTDHGWGLMLGLQNQAAPEGAIRIFAEYRRFRTAQEQRYSLSDAGVALTGTITGPLYGFLGASAERIHLPGLDPTIKLGTRAGLGWTLGKHAGLEAGYTRASLDRRSVDSMEASLIFTF